MEELISEKLSRLNFLLVARCLLHFACCSLLFACCSLLSACCSLLFARCSFLSARCPLLFARCSLLFARCFYFSFVAFSQLLWAIARLLVTRVIPIYLLDELFVFSFLVLLKEMRTRGESKISSCCFCVLGKSRELRGRGLGGGGGRGVQDSLV